MSDVTENDLLEELIASMPPPYNPAVHVTVQAFAERAGMSESNALSYLDSMVRQRQLKKLRVRRDDGYVVVAFVRA